MFFLVKGSFIPIFTKKYLYLSPLEYIENENFDVRALAHTAHACRNVGFDLFCTIKKKFPTPSQCPHIVNDYTHIVSAWSTTTLTSRGQRLHSHRVRMVTTTLTSCPCGQ